MGKQVEAEQLTEFEVNGRGPFPVDMLRYDMCWPKSGDDAAKLVSSDEDRASRGVRTVRMLAIRKPTCGRWASFGWTVVTIDGGAAFPRL